MLINKPVAWMLIDEINGDYMLERHPSGDYDWFPLYTHPVKEHTTTLMESRAKIFWNEVNTHPVKELTDEEIEQVHKETFSKLATDLDFARAILRKAQEK